MEQACLTQPLADIRIVRGHQQLHRVVKRRHEGLIGRYTRRQPSAHGYDEHDTDYKAYHSRNEDGEHVHRPACSILVEIGHHDVGRSTDQRTHTAHLYSIHHRKVKLRRRHVELSGPAFQYIAEEYGEHRIADKGAQSSRWHHHAQQGHRVELGQSEQMPHHPLQHASIAQARHHHGQNARNDHSTRTKPRARLFGVEHARGKQHADSDEHHGIGSHLRQQHHRNDTHHGSDGNPGIYTKAPQDYVIRQFHLCSPSTFIQFLIIQNMFWLQRYSFFAKPWSFFARIFSENPLNFTNHACCQEHEDRFICVTYASRNYQICLQNLYSLSFLGETRQ